MDFLEKEILLPSALASRIADSKEKITDSRSVAGFLKDFWNPFLENRDDAVDEVIFHLFRIPIQRHSQVANPLGISFSIGC